MSDWIGKAKTRPALVGLLVSLLMVLAVFHEYFLFHRTLITDSDVGMQYAYRAAAAKALMSFGELPLWNPLAFTGISWIGQDPWANVLHPFLIFSLILDSPIDAYMFGLILIFFLAGWGTFYVSRAVVGLSLTASIVATGVYLFNYDIHEHIAMLFSAGAFLGLPFMVILADRYSKTFDLQYPLWAAVFATLCYLSSNVLCLEILVLSYIVFVVLLTFQQQERLPSQTLWSSLLFVVITLLLSSFILWPAIDNRLVTIRSHLEGTRQHWWFLFETFWTQAFGLFDMPFFHHDVWHYQKSPVFHEFIFGEWLRYLNLFFQMPGAYGYISVLLFPLTIWAILHRRNRWVTFFGVNVLVLAAIGIVEGLPFIGRVFFFATGGHSLLRPGMALLLLCSAGLIGLFFDSLGDWIVRCSEPIRRIMTTGSTVLVVLCTLIFSVYVGIVLSVHAMDPGKGELNPEQYKAAVISHVQAASRWLPLPASAAERASRIPADKFALLLSFYSLGSLFLMSARYVSRVGLILWFRRVVTMRHFSWGTVRWTLASLVLLDCFVNQQAMGGFTDRVYYVFNPQSVESRFMDRLSLSNRTATVFVSIQDKQSFKIVSETQQSRPLSRRFGGYGSFYPLLLNYQMVHLVPSYSTYISMVPPAVAVFHREISKGVPEFELFLRKGDRIDSAFYLLNPTHDLVNELAIDYFFVPLGHELRQEGVLLVENGADYAIYKNLRAKPRIELQLTHPNQLGSQESNGRLIRSEFRFNTVQVEVETDTPSQVILRDTYDPHWTCEVDGLPVKISPYKDLFRQVEIGPGRHQLTFRYTNRAFDSGLSVSIMTLISVVTALIIRSSKRLRFG